ncbi:MAG: mechanosensitive ion channel domain-containing protein [Nanoarchaeota archaeon]|nr:mechanosensitive ion channel family protein [Nanoarchaeota archaeon]MBU1445068.1 mechanosensitive ion channel family protein [Nanoarchaeota archaeon]MBU2406493.1 mechanosensitive ion channel family protein [Nanoarchaeota archaeon]MBU2420593.1 mechanosensitive ion channel family protein [Nanoarchaeota archaeon]MBU2475195.1 mechanosensitive ion channel family protein [Nanoarchaeota archaeon]
MISINSDIQLKLLISIVSIIVLWIIRIFILKGVFKKTEDVKLRYQWRKSIGYILFFIGVLILISVWFEGFGSAATFFGLVSAGIAIALKDPIVNLVGWIHIISRKPFEVGDRIQVGNCSGDVIDISAFDTSVLEIGNWVEADQSTGRIIHIPNGKVFIDFVANYTKGFEYIWNEIPVLVTFESDWKKAKEILQKIAIKNAEQISEPAERKIKETSKRFMIFYKNLKPIVYTKVENSGVLLTVKYLIEARKRRGSEQGMWEDILEEFNKHKDIDFAYPTKRVYDNKLKGKGKSKK